MLNLCRQLEKTQEVGDRSTFLAHSECHLLLSEIALFYKPLIAHCHFDRVKVLPLDILDDSHFQHSLVVGIAYICGNHIHPRKPAGAKTALTAYDLIFTFRYLTDRNRLYQPESSDGISELIKSFLVESHSRLVRIRLDKVNRNPQDVGR